jgi:hypothetical protein
MMQPHEEAAAIFNHYFAQLAERAGLRWSERNAGDIARAVELLAQTDEEPTDSIPPYERPIVSDRVTQVLERDEPTADYGDANFARWRGQRRWSEEEDVRRLVRR